MSTKCRCCEHQIKVKTIDDMLKRAYEIVDKDKNITLLLYDLSLDKYSVGITQEYTRLKMLSKPFDNFIEDYRCIQESDAGFYLGFNENFTVLEEIEVSTKFFNDEYIRGYKVQFNSLSNQEKIEFLENTFAKYNSKLEGLSSFIKVKYLDDYISTEIVLKMPNQRVLENKAYAFYPDTKKYPYFEFDLDHKDKNGRLRSIKLKLNNTEPINEPISNWLHQSIIYMYPDYGSCYLWFDGTCGCLESIEGYNLENTDLAKKLEAWQEIFEDSFTRSDIDWIEFDKTGWISQLWSAKRRPDDRIG